MELGSKSENLFKSPEEEISHIESSVVKKESDLSRIGLSQSRESLIKDKINEYSKFPADQALHESYQLQAIHVENIALELTPESHDRKMEELYSLLKEKGIKNTLSVIEKMGDSHVEDDFHRFLIQYIKQGFKLQGLSEKAPLYKALNMTLFEVVIPEKADEKRGLKEIISGMEQFYAGMLSISTSKNPSENHIAIEIANSNGSDEFVFYVSVPNSKKSLFEKQLLSIFPEALVNEKKDDHNIFNEGGVVVSSVAEAKGNTAFSIKTYEEFDHDPMNIILQSFSKINKVGEGACLQILMHPSGDFYTDKFKKGVSSLEEGKSLKEAFPEGATVMGVAGTIFGELFGGKKKEEKNEPVKIDRDSIDKVNKKLASPIAVVNIRLAVSAADIIRAEQIHADIESAFRQFDNPLGLSFEFKKNKFGKDQNFIRNFSFRLFSESDKIPLNLKELTSLMHFHTEALKAGNQLKTLKAGSAPAPTSFVNDGTILGLNTYQGSETKVIISDEDRLRHFYTIGQTGTGKSTLLKSMIIQDIQRGNGVCMIDPHGTDIEDVLKSIPQERIDDVIYFDPSYTERPMGLNMLEYDRRFPEQKTFVVNELFNIFQKLYGAVPESMGPMFEQYFRNATMLVIEDPDSGSTLLDVSRVLSNKEFRLMKLSKCKNPIVVQFWKEIAEKAGGEASLANIVPYITSKFDVFLANDIMRPIVAQEHSAFNFREIMDQKKILLVNLSKGRLGDINANLLGLILVGKILMAALSRVDSIGTSAAGSLAPFYLYIDEFQNITTPSIATILSEARKYKLSLSIAHQFIAQLEESIKNAVFGNVGSITAFRVGTDDAEYLAKQFEPVFKASDLVNLDNRKAVIKMLVNGKPEKPFNIETLPISSMIGGTDSKTIKALSYGKYGREKSEVEGEISLKYQSLI